MCSSGVLKVTELECVSSQANAVHTHKTELNQTIEELESMLKKKEEEIERLKQENNSARELQAQRDYLTQKLKEANEERHLHHKQPDDAHVKISTGATKKKRRVVVVRDSTLKGTEAFICQGCYREAACSISECTAGICCHSDYQVWCLG
ncbi:uncharacterized protein LOC136004341 isoform X1 [Lathamus discolor]|uniref:uncharacterized protein LOC136004341 isoform X1 n=1 Tax=Lathamus discolor TaxID=678569 RepID=UPI0032B7F696